MGSYGSDGYTFLLSPLNKQQFANDLYSLQQDNFFDVATRGVFLEFNLWNMNMGAYTVVRVAIEVSSSGTAKSSSRVLVITQDKLEPGGLGSTGEWLPLIGLAILLLFVVWYVVEEFFEAKDTGWRYFLDPWNVMDWVNILLLVVSILLRVSVFAKAVSISLGVGELGNNAVFTNLQGFAQESAQFRTVNAFNAVILWVKCAKYIGFFPYLQTVVRTIGSALSFLVPLLILVFFVLFGYVTAFHVAFGSDMREISTFWGAFLFLIRSFLRDVDMMPIYKISPLFGAFMILGFYVVVLLVGFNVLFAIIADEMRRQRAQEKVREADRIAGKEIDNEDVEDPIGEFFRLIKSMLYRCAKMHPCFKWVLTFGGCIAKVPPPDPAEKKEVAEPDSTGTDIVRARPTYRDSVAQNLQAKDEGSRKFSIWDQEEPESPKGGTRSTSLARKSIGSVASAGDFGEVAVQEEKMLYRPDRPVSEFTSKEVLQSVDQMAGRLLSRIQSMGIEMRAEASGVCETLGAVHAAVEKLSEKLDRIQEGQTEALKTLEERGGITT